MRILPEGWVHQDLVDITTKIGSGSTPRGGQEAYKTEGIPLVRSMNVRFSGIATKGLAFIDDEQAAKLSAVTINDRDVLLNITGASIGRVSVARDWAIGGRVNQHVCIIRPVFPDPLSDYLNYYLMTPVMQDYINSNESGATRQALTKAKVESLSIPLAPLAEQKRIVEKLDEVLAQVDTIKARLDGIPSLLKRFCQSVLASAVSGKLTEEWRGQGELMPNVLPSDFTTKKYGDVADDEHYDNIPNSWGWVKLGSLVELINGDRGKNYPNKSEYVDEGIAFINTGHIDPDGTLSFKRMNYISEDKFSSLGSGKIQKNDIVYCLRGATMGKTAIVNPFEIGAIASSLVIVRPSECLFYKFAYYFLVSPQAKEQIQRFDNGSAQPNLSAKSLGMYPIGLPSFEEQKEIVRLVDQYFAFADTIEAQVKKAQARVNNLTQSILAKAFRGELVPQDPNDESADKLLERIAQARIEAEALAKATKKAETARKKAEKSAAKG